MTPFSWESDVPSTWGVSASPSLWEEIGFPLFREGNNLQQDSQCLFFSFLSFLSLPSFPSLPPSLLPSSRPVLVGTLPVSFYLSCFALCLLCACPPAFPCPSLFSLSGAVWWALSSSACAHAFSCMCAYARALSVSLPRFVGGKQ